MKIPGIELAAVNPLWKMSIHAWLNVATMNREYSIKVKDPDYRNWAHIYTVDGGLKKFKTTASAQRFIDKLKRTSSEKETAKCTHP